MSIKLSSEQKLGHVAVALLAVVASILVGLYGLTGVSFERAQNLKYREFRSQLADGSAAVNSPSPRGTAIAIVKVPSIGLDAVVLEGSDSRTLQSGVGHLRSSTLPGQYGTSVLLGRRSLFGGVFGRIGHLAEGATITVLSAQGESTYVVRSVGTYAASDPGAIAPAGNALRLVTGTSSWTGGNRISVLAVATTGSVFPVGERGTIEPISSDELGLNFDHAAAGSLLAWLQVLVLVALGSTFIAHRWGWSRAWIFAAPVDAAVGVVVTLHIAAVLPGLA